MSEKKLYAIVCGAVIGAVAVVAAVKYAKSHRSDTECTVQDISDIIKKAKETINLIDDAVDALKA